MAISIKRYVDIVSAVIGAAAASLRELVARLFTSNPLVPTASLIEFTSAKSVGDYFGYSSEEYLRALFYFGWVSKGIKRAPKLGFAAYTPNDTAPLIYGPKAALSVSTFTAISDGAFVLTLGPDTNTISGLDFTSETTLAGIATVIQTAVRAETGAMWTAASVTYDATRGSFNLVGGSTGAAIVSVSAPLSGTNLLGSGLLGWGLSDAILSNGAVAQSPSEAFSASVDASTNFGSFDFIDALTLEEITAVAQLNDTYNNTFLYSVGVEEINFNDYYAALSDIGGVALTEVGVSGEWPQMLPMMILAATDYTKPNSVQNYMFQTADLTPTVSTDAAADVRDASRINYYGRTQTAGKNISFYQRGYMLGGLQDPSDINVYANEIWLKDAASVACLNLLLAKGHVPANEEGAISVRAVLQSDVIDVALFNGAISVGKTLTADQKQAIADLSNSDTAWYQVQNSGYWLNVTISPYTGQGGTEYRAEYTLIYSKDDAVRKVNGYHALA